MADGNLKGTTRSSKVYVSIGKVSIKKKNGQIKTEGKYITMSEDQAKITGVPYTRYAPAPITITTKKGKTFTREVPITVGKIYYRLGYVVGTKVVDGKKVPNIKWVPLPVPKGMNLKQMLQLVRSSLFKKKPVYFQTDSSTTRFVDVK
jgi:hypothetical protein